MANKDKKNIHDSAQDVIEGRPYCAGRVERWSKKYEKWKSRPCKLQSTLLGDELGNPACQWHGGRPDPEKQRKPRSKEVAALSSKHPSQGGVSVMGTTSNATFSSRWTQLTNGELTVEDLDTEELVKGMVRDADGVIRGRGTKMVPRDLAQAMKNELFDRARHILEQDLVTAAEVLGEIARNPDVEPQHRMRAAQMIIERVMGKTPETIQVAAAKPYEALMTKITRMPSAVIEAEYAEVVEEQGDDRY